MSNDNVTLARPVRGPESNPRREPDGKPLEAGDAEHSARLRALLVRGIAGARMALRARKPS